MFNLFGKKQKTEEISRTTPGFEETERKTPKAGVILLVIMFIAGIFFGWRALDDLGRIPKTPEPLSSCSSLYRSAYVRGGIIEPFEPTRLYREGDYYSSYYGERDYTNCRFNALEQKQGIPALFVKKAPLEQSRSTLKKSLTGTQNSLRSVQNQMEQLMRQYGIGLEELESKIEDPLFPARQAAEQIRSLRTQEQRLKDEVGRYQAQLSPLESQIKAVNDEISATYKPVFKAYNRELRWYDFQVFLLQMIFTLPLFWFSFRGYRRLHAKSSPYTVIAVAILAVAAILFLRVLLFWFWDLFLAEVLRTLLEWIQRIQILRSIVFYLGMILSFVIFGGAVFWLQKKIFDPRRVMIRRFRAKQCPQCQTNLDLAAFYCPNCGYQLKEKCEQCGQARFVGLPNCPYCGAKKQVQK